MKRHLHYALLSCVVVLIASCGGNATTQSASPTPQSTIVASPTTTPNAETTQPIVLSSGNFVNGEHPTQGKAEIINQGGKRMLQLSEQFASTSGPDLVVVLHRSANVIGETTPPAYPLKESSYTVLAPLKQNNGAQSYEIPENINLDDFQSVAIWCRQFNATFGAATLKSSS